MTLSNKIERKFVSSLDTTEWEVLTEDGYKDITQIHKTVEYEKWTITLANGLYIDCADTHILIDYEYNEIFAKDSLGCTLRTENGLSEVISVMNNYTSENMYDVTVDSDMHTYYTNSILSHNTTSLVGFLLHYILFNSEKTVGILAHKKDGAVEVLDRLQLAYEHIPKYMQQGVSEWNKGNITLENGSKVLTSASNGAGVRGKSLAVLVVDETAFIPNNQWDDFWAGTYPVISSGKETKTILISTVNGLNHFHKIWSDAKQGISTFKPVEVNWWDVPGRDDEWKNNMIGDIGERRFAQEFGNNFLGSSNTLISTNKLISLVMLPPISVKDDLKVYEYAQTDHIYFMTVDVGYGRGQDYSTFSVFDITEYPIRQVATYRSNQISAELYPNFIFNVGMNYNSAYVLVENNDIGKTALQVLNYELEYENLITLNEGMKRNPEMGCRMTSRVKSIGCNALKDTIEDDKLIIADENTILEMNTFVAKGSSYEADMGKNDDSVMNLVMFCYMMRTELFEDISNHNYRENMYKARIESIEDDMMAFFTLDEIEDTAWLQ